MAKLILVPTPIGNLKDITYRAVEVLKSAEFILCEDTRVSSKLLSEYQISKPLKSYHQANEHKILESVTEQIANSEMVALITDAGTPGISDPGFLLIRECIKNEIGIECLPGATAFVPALVQSGIPCDRFYFEGFLPHKKGRQTLWKYIAELDHTAVMYESCHRIEKFMNEMEKTLGPERVICIGRELTKKFETILSGKISDLRPRFDQGSKKGEFVVLIAPEKYEL